MTECERIISSGILPEEFLREEVRCEFRVDTERKKIWAIELDMLLKFDAVCRKHGLEYFLCGGSLLGAVRHKGFIPWDDDLDVEMFRPDYEKFLALSEEFEYPYFLQTPYTDKNAYFSYAKLRNSNTTGLNKRFEFQDMNQGILMDIFPVDYVRGGVSRQDFERIRALCIENGTYMRKSNPCLSEADKKRVREWSGRDPLQVYEEIQSIARRYEGQETEYCMLAVETMFDYDHKLMYAADYRDLVLCDFEGFEFPIPAGYDRILSICYGDYMKYPPVEERGAWHADSLIFEPDVPYRYFLAGYRRGVLERTK